MYLYLLLLRKNCFITKLYRIICKVFCSHLCASVTKQYNLALVVEGW